MSSGVRWVLVLWIATLIVLLPFTPIFSKKSILFCQEIKRSDPPAATVQEIVSETETLGLKKEIAILEQRNVGLSDELAQLKQRMQEAQENEAQDLPLSSGLSNADFIHVVGTHSGRHALAKAARSWRKGIRALIATNSSQGETDDVNEIWKYYPDGDVAKFPGDARAAYTPSLGYLEYHVKRKDSFKWMLFGDDDTIFFKEGIWRMLEGLDSEDPYFISDNYFGLFNGDGNGPQKRNQMRCLPCTFDDTGVDVKASYGILTCNCTAQLFCDYYKPWPEGGRSPDCRVNPIDTINGGGGAVFSIGLLKRMNHAEFERCIETYRLNSILPCFGGDCLLTQCMWRQGFGLTDPGHELLHNNEFVFDYPNGDRETLKKKMESYVDGSCDKACKRALNHMVTLHMGGAGFTDYNEAAKVVKTISSLYDSVLHVNPKQIISKT